MCVSGCKICLFFGNFGVLCFLETSVLRFALLPYHQRIDVVFPLECSFIGNLTLSHFISALSERILNENTPNKFKQKTKNFQIFRYFFNISILILCSGFLLSFATSDKNHNFLNSSALVFLSFYLLTFSFIIHLVLIWCLYCIYLFEVNTWKHQNNV